MVFILFRRKNIGVKAVENWKGQYPKFNTPERKMELKKFAENNVKEFGMPEVGFSEEGIMKHVQSFFNEQRRYRKRPHSKVVTLSNNLYDHYIKCFIKKWLVFVLLLMIKLQSCVD